MMTYLGASVSAVIEAPIENLWVVVSDVARHPELAGSGEVQRVDVLSPGPLTKGTLFRAEQRAHGLAYTVVSRVVAWEPPYRFAWRVGIAQAPGSLQIWQFTLTPQAYGTQVENSVTLPYVVPGVWPLTMLRETVGRNEAAVIRPTLLNLARCVGAPEPTAFKERRDPPADAVALLPSPLLQQAAWFAGTLVVGALVRRRGKSPPDSSIF
jgi:hypothetical protein